jgi:hypothetical protein
VSAQELVNRLREQSAEGKPYDWVEVRKEIHEESEKATSPQDHDLLRALHFAVMSHVESTPDAVKPDHWETSKTARHQDFNLLIARECVVQPDGHVSVDDLYRVTRQEIAAGRMDPNDKLAKDAEGAYAAPHLTRVQLIAQSAKNRKGEHVVDKGPTPDRHETREFIRRAVIVGWGVLLLIPTAWTFLFLGGTQLGWYLFGGVAAAFFIGRAVINWVFLK